MAGQPTSQSRIQTSHENIAGWSHDDRQCVDGRWTGKLPHRFHSTRCPLTRAQDADRVIFTRRLDSLCHGFNSSMLAAVEVRREFLLKKCRKKNRFSQDFHRPWNPYAQVHLLCRAPVRCTAEDM